MQKYFYQTIKNNNEHEIPKIKGSKFVGNVFKIKKKHKGANHYCYAYSLGTKTNLKGNGETTIEPKKNGQNDDGEPTNTAGKPILAQIKGNNLNNVFIIVTRYFGGTLLGTGGLIQAYGECAKQTINTAKQVKIEIKEELTISFDYCIISTIMNTLNKYETTITKESHGTKAKITFEINQGYINNFKKEIFDQTKGQIKL